MSFSNLEKLLFDIGAHLEKPDLNKVFYLFNVKQDNYIDQDEFASLLMLSDYEIDNIILLIRMKLLNKPGITNKSSEDKKASLGTNSSQIRDNKLLSNIFQSVNLNKDGVLSLDEIVELCASLEIYVTQDEALKIMHCMDINCDGRVEEKDFIAFIQRVDDVIVRKANRVKESSSVIRRWLKRRTTTPATSGPVSTT